MLPQNYQQQQENEIKQCMVNIGSGSSNSEMCSDNRTNDTNTNCKDIQNASPPFRDTQIQLDSGKSSQLKEAHSALVKILESAPIYNKSTKLNENTAMPSMKLITKAASKETIVSGAFASIPSADVHMDNVMMIADGQILLKSEPKQSATLLVNQWISQCNVTDKQQHHQYYHRKRNKHLIDHLNCDMDKSSDEEIGYNSNSSGHSSANEAELVCPWKKTRIAREWHQSQTKIADRSMPMDEQMSDMAMKQILPPMNTTDDVSDQTATINTNALHRCTPFSTVIIAQETTEQLSPIENPSNLMRHRFNYAQQNSKDGYYDSGDDISDDNG